VVTWSGSLTPLAGIYDPISGLFAPRVDGTGVTTIESIDQNDPTIINLSQAVGTSQAGAAYKFSKPSMSSPAIAGYNPATGKLDIGLDLLANFNPTDNEWVGVPHVIDFAQFAYQMLSLMSQIRNTNAKVPISVQVMSSVIGGLITNADLNGDHFHKTEIAYRT